MTNTPSRIVLIEDEEILANLLSQKLQDAGFHVDVAHDGEEGLELIRTKEPDLVLLDMMLPKVGGYSILETIHDEGLLPDLPVVIISNSGQPVEIERAEKLGVRDYLVKLNFDPDEVIERVQAVLDGGGKSAQDGESAQPEDDQPAVLIVEDDMFIADLLGRKLHENFGVHQASDTNQAMRILEDHDVDLICLDIILPGEDGYSFLSRIKSMSEYRDIPVLILSNLGQREEVEKGIKAGAADYLIKANMSPEEILNHVARLLKKGSKTGS